MSSKIINNFISQYNKQYDFYTELARISSDLLETELRKKGIKAIVSHRAKSPDRLLDKIQNRSKKKNYNTVDDVFNDIVDLAGVRVALYFPSERDLVDDLVKDIFKIMKKKVFPESSHKPKYSKRFSGYWATHYRVELKNEEDSTKRYLNTQLEIQVASVLMHAWAEVEHDMIYKTLSGDLSEDEYATLDEINGLVLSGEIALERLQKAMARRTTESNEFSNQFELTNFLRNSLGKNYFEKLKLGDTKYLNLFFKTVKEYNPKSIVEYVNNVNQGEKESISDQILNMIIRDYFETGIKDKSLDKYFESINSEGIDTSPFESFVKAWIVLEKAIIAINKENNIHHRKYFVPKFDVLSNFENVKYEDIKALDYLRKTRNMLVHGIETPSDKYLKEKYLKLKEIASRVIFNLKNEKLRTELQIELESI